MDAFLRYFNAVEMQMYTPECEKLAKMNSEVVEKIKEACCLYIRGLKEDDTALKARANIMAALEASALATQTEEYSRQLKEEFNLVY